MVAMKVMVLLVGKWRAQMVRIITDTLKDRPDSFRQMGLHSWYNLGDMWSSCYNQGGLCNVCTDELDVLNIIIIIITMLMIYIP